MAGVVAIRARGGRRLAEIARVQAEVQAACSEANKADGAWMHAALLRGAGGGGARSGGVGRAGTCKSAKASITECQHTENMR